MKNYQIRDTIERVRDMVSSAQSELMILTEDNRDAMKEHPVSEALIIQAYSDLSRVMALTFHAKERIKRQQ